jgi:hypothetical protein
MGDTNHHLPLDENKGTDTDYGVGGDINQEEITDETGFGEEKPTKKTKNGKKEIKRYTEEELRERLKSLEKGQKPKITTTMVVKALSSLDKIKKNTDIILLLLHTMFCLICGAVMALGVYLDHTWLQASGGFTGLVSFITFLLSYLNPKGDLSNYLNREDLVEQLNKLSQRDFKRLYENMGQTEFFQNFRK